MNCKRLSLIAAVPMSLALAGFAFGQVPSSQPPEQTPPAQPQYPQSQQNQSMHNSMRNRSSHSKDFSQLAGSKGYVTRSEARNDPWLSMHFSKCDSNHDSKISRSEYQQCHRGAPSSGM